MSVQLEKDIFVSGTHTPLRSRSGAGKKSRSYKSDPGCSRLGYSSQKAGRSARQDTRDPYLDCGYEDSDYDNGSDQVLRVTNYHPSTGHCHTTTMDSLGRKSVTFNNNKYKKDTTASPNSNTNKDNKDSSGTTTPHSGTTTSTTLPSGIQTRSNSSTMNGLSNGDVYEGVRESYSNNYNGVKKGSNQRMRPKKVGETQWYTRPLHLGSKEVNNGNSGQPARSISPINRPDGPVRGDSGSSPPHKSDSSTENSDLHNVSSKDLDTTNNTSMASSTDLALMREHFPVTFGASHEAGKPLSPTQNGNISAGSLSPPVKGGGLSSAELASWKHGSHQRTKSPGRSKRPSSGHSSTSSRSRSRKSRPSSAQSSSSSASKSSLDRMYLMSVEAPTIGQSSVLLSSPYQSELARLRMERLRIEEDHLLEVKRQEELERIRGPKPKWYELKGPQFHYEAHKNNSLISSKDDWQGLLDYRTDLEKASKQFQHAYSAAGST